MTTAAKKSIQDKARIRNIFYAALDTSGGIRPAPSVRLKDSGQWMMTRVDIIERHPKEQQLPRMPNHSRTCKGGEAMAMGRRHQPPQPHGPGETHCPALPVIHSTNSSTLRLNSVESVALLKGAVNQCQTEEVS